MHKFVYYDNINDFYRDQENITTMKIFIDKYFSRDSRANIQLFDQNDMISFITQRTIKYKTLEKYDKNVSSFYTYFANHVNFSIQVYYNKYMKNKEIPFTQIATGYNKEFIVGKYDRHMQNFEALHDFMAFLKWYKSNLMVFCREEAQRTKGKDGKYNIRAYIPRAGKLHNIEIKIMIHKLNGLNATEIGIILGVPPGVVWFYLKKMKAMYKVFLKSGI